MRHSRRSATSGGSSRTLRLLRGSDAIQRGLKLTGVEQMLVLADDPEELAPPTYSRRPAGSPVLIAARGHRGIGHVGTGSPAPAWVAEYLGARSRLETP